jgi:hypothetical protein
MSEFWIGILLSIPIGIATSLITPWIQRKIDEQDKRRSLAATGRLVQEYERIRAFRSDPHEFTQYLVQVVIRTTFTGALVAVFAGLMVALGQATIPLRRSIAFDVDFVRTAIFILAQFVSLLGSLLIINICRPALRAWTKLKNFDEYSASVELLQKK